MLKKLHKDFRSAFIQGLKLAMLFAESKIKKSFNKQGKPKIKTGNLRRNIGSGVKVGTRNAIGFVSADTIYARILERGGTIFPRTSDYLRFQIGGKWISKRSVRIPPYPYLQPGLEDNINKIEDIIVSTIFKKVN
jgi:hypothetical protein